VLHPIIKIGNRHHTHRDKYKIDSRLLHKIPFLRFPYDRPHPEARTQDSTEHCLKNNGFDFISHDVDKLWLGIRTVYLNFNLHGSSLLCGLIIGKINAAFNRFPIVG